jgi:hypothetical protein
MRICNTSEGTELENAGPETRSQMYQLFWDIGPSHPAKVAIPKISELGIN